jgi:hypothetical protein
MPILILLLLLLLLLLLAFPIIAASTVSIDDLEVKLDEKSADISDFIDPVDSVTISTIFKDIQASEESIIPLMSEGPSTAIFSGKVLYQPSTKKATVKLYNSAGNLMSTTTTATDGSFSFSVIAGSNFTLVVTKPGYLSYTIKNLSLADGLDIGNIDIRLLAGDINVDGIVNAIDLTFLLTEFNRAPRYYQNADIDGNGIVNAADLTYLLAGFNKRDVIVNSSTIKNVTVNLYAASSSSTYTTIAQNAAYSYEKTFDMKMNISIKGTVSLNTLQTAECIKHGVGTVFSGQPCKLPPYHKDYDNGFGILKKYYETDNIKFLQYVNNSGYGLHTLFVDYYVHGSGCDITALGVTYPSGNHVIFCSEYMRHPGFDDRWCYPFRVLQHEWSHCYGVDFDPYNFSTNDPRRCQSRCIMMGDFMNENDGYVKIENVWCSRCKNIIQGNRTKWD